MSTTVILIGLLLVQLLLLWRAAPVSRSSDHYYHDTIIDFIRLNRHRFLRERPDFLYDSKMVYPQLYHWLFSFVPASRKEPAVWFSSIAFSVGSYVLFLWFLDQIFPALAETYPVNRNRFAATAMTWLVSIRSTSRCRLARTPGGICTPPDHVGEICAG